MDVAKHKVAGIRRFQQAGYRVVAAVDNEPEVIEALVAPTRRRRSCSCTRRCSTSRDDGRRPRTVGGCSYDITSLVGERDPPRHVQLVWHGVNDDANLRQFLASPVRWAEVDVRRHPRGRLVLRHDAFDMGEPAANGWGATGAGDGLLSLDEALAELRDAGKGVLSDVKEAGILDEVLAVVARPGVTDEDLWLNGRLDVLGEDGVRAIRATHPGATVQCPIDFIAPLAIAMPNEALGLLRTLTGWGVAARMANVRGANTEGCHKRPSGISMLLAWIEMWPPPCISMFSFSCPTSTRLIGSLGAPERAQTTDSRRSPDALIATSRSPARTRMDKTPASQSTISRRIDEPCRSTGGG